MRIHSLAVIAGLTVLLLAPAQAHLAGEGGMKSLGFPPGDYFADHAEKDFVPAQLSPDQALRLRGVVSRLHAWKPGSTISVCFLSGTQKARARVVAAAQEWMKWAAIRFDFGAAANPRLCDKAKAEKAADIKIGFASGADGGYWSYLGTQSRRYAHSMNFEDFGDDELPVTIGMEKFTGIVLHEFGHALGLEHEHQSRNASCADEFDWKAIYAWGNSMGWPKETVDFNFRRLLGTRTERRFSPYDPHSIMHYSLPVTFFRNGRASRCYTEENHHLSETDKTFIARIYPAKPAERRSYTDFLLSEFRGVLKEGGLPEAEIARREKALPAQFNITIITAGGNVTQTGDITTQGDMSPVVTGTDGDVNITIRSGGDEPDDDDERNKEENGKGGGKPKDRD